MDHFFLRLIDRMGETGPRVEPLIPSFYAREAAPAGLSDIDPPGEEEAAETDPGRGSGTEAGKNPETGAWTSSGFPRRPAPAAPSPPALSRAQRDDALPAPGSDMDLPDKGKGVVPPGEGTARPRADAPRPAPAKEGMKAGTAASASTPGPRSVSPAAKDRSRKGVPAAAEVPAGPAAADPVPAAAARSWPVPDLPEAAETLLVPAARSREERDSLPGEAFYPAGEARPLPPADPPAPPTRVTIGRIEVRAAVQPAPRAPAPRPAQRPSGPALSLEDYLNTREGKRP